MLRRLRLATRAPSPTGSTAAAGAPLACSVLGLPERFRVLLGNVGLWFRRESGKASVPYNAGAACSRDQKGPQLEQKGPQ